MTEPKRGNKGATEPRSRRSKNRSKRRKKPEKKWGPERHAHDVVTALHRLLGSLTENRGLVGDVPLEELVVPLRIKLGNSDREADAKELVAAVQGRVKAAIKAFGGWRQGHVYCFQCDAPGCVHAAPPAPDSAFAGYTPTGRPTWLSLTDLCLRVGDTRVARVFGSPPEVIAFVQSGESLSDGVLPHFGGVGQSLSVMGQVVAGLLPAAYGMHEGHDRVAVTIQVIQMPNAGRRGRFRLNLLGTSWDRIADVLADEGDKGSAEGFRAALATARHSLRSQSMHLRRLERAGGTSDPHAVVQPILAALQRDIERVFRGHKWRTQHAEHRHREGDRPTLTAIAEARQTPTNRLLRDPDRNTLVVLGRKGRAHVFSDEGRHVTSLQLGPGEAQRKLSRGRWRPVSESTARSFKSALRSRSENGDAVLKSAIDCS